MKELTIKVPAVDSSSYKIVIGNEILSNIWSKLHEDMGDCSRFVITDTNIVLSGHFKALIGSEKIGAFIIDPPGEKSKTIDTVVSIVEAMEAAFLGRDSVLIALGGGTVGDIAGFAAAIFKRGISVIQIPTSTVAQADSAVGGKTGVDSSISKNAFGVFWQPSAVYIDVSTLKTLDDRQYRAGLIESVKHALIADVDYFDYLEANLDAVLGRESEVLEEIACRNCRIKASVVEIDPNEKNQRRILNYGHTIGHAVESVSGFELLHGEAVAIGIIGAALIEIELGLGDKARLERVKSLLKRLDVPVAIPKKLAKEQLIDIIRRDKKAANKWPKFALIEKIGKAHCLNGQWAHDVAEKIVGKTLDELYEKI